jgi:hypothetical protein
MQTRLHQGSSGFDPAAHTRAVQVADRLEGQDGPSGVVPILLLERCLKVLELLRVHALEIEA